MLMVYVIRQRIQAVHQRDVEAALHAQILIGGGHAVSCSLEIPPCQSFDQVCLEGHTTGRSSGKSKKKILK